MRKSWVIDLSLQRLLLKNTGVQIAPQAVSLVVGLATSLVLSRYLGMEGFGQFNCTFAFFYFFLNINDFGVTTIAVRDASKQRERVGVAIEANARAIGHEKSNPVKPNTGGQACPTLALR